MTPWPCVHKNFFKRIRIRVYDAIFISGKTLKSGVCGSPNEE